MNSFRDKSDTSSDIFVLNNFDATHTQIKSSLFQSKLQQSIQNFRQLTKPIAMHIETQIQPVQKPESDTTERKQHHLINFDDSTTERHQYNRDTQNQVNKQLDFSQISVQNQFQYYDNLETYQYRTKETIKTKTKNILEHYHSSTFVATVVKIEDCFKILQNTNGSQLIKMPTNLILEILKQREEMQHQVVLQRRLITALIRQEQQQ